MTRFLSSVAASFIALGLALPATAQPVVQPPAAPSVGDETNDAAEARALLARMADYLAKAPSFSVTINAGYDVVQASGQKIEFGETRHVVLKRPDELRIDLEQSNGDTRQVLFDGKAITLYTPADKVYASLQKPGTVDDIIQYLTQDLKTPIPLSLLLVTSMPKILDSGITEADVVEDTTVAGRPATHVAARLAEVDVQVWVADGDQPVPLRVVITYKNAEGEPQFSALLKDWDFNPKIDPASFTFVPPPGAEGVPFMVPAAGPDAPHASRK